MKKIDKTILLCLSAPAGFALCSAFLYYGLKNIPSAFLAKLGIVFSGAEAFVVLPLAAFIGSYLGFKFTQRLLKSQVALLPLVIGSILGCELGLGVEFSLLLRQRFALNNSILYCASMVVLLSSFMGALIGAHFSKEPKQG